MKYAVVAALLTLAAAQSASDIPSCAKPCLDDAVTKGTSCSTTDYACICPHIAELQGAATSCVLEKCGADVALGQVLPAVQALCKAAGSAPASSSAPASTGSAPATSSHATSAPATTAGPKSTEWTTVPCDTTTIVSQTHAGNTTQPKPTTSVPVAAGAAGLSAGVAAIALAALALYSTYLALQLPFVARCSSSKVALNLDVAYPFFAFDALADRRDSDRNVDLSSWIRTAEALPYPGSPYEEKLPTLAREVSSAVARAMMLLISSATENVGHKGSV
ncbi:hypothetical protein PWT90_09397 [Aphanocladium album]|nr:hypothetical protein PWT90_09397 [Aphanocladium album]